jgi:hypothetical protein
MKTEKKKERFGVCLEFTGSTILAKTKGNKKKVEKPGSVFRCSRADAMLHGKRRCNPQ